MNHETIYWSLTEEQLQGLHSWIEEAGICSFGYFNGREYQPLWENGQLISREMRLNILPELPVVPLVCQLGGSWAVGCFEGRDITPEQIIELPAAFPAAVACFEFSDVARILELMKVDWEILLSTGYCASLVPLASCLHSLSLHTGSANLEHVASLVYLEQLCLDGDYSAVTELELISQLKCLTELALSGFTSLSNLDGLGKLSKLTNLYICGCESLKIIDGLKGLPKLTKLTFQENKSLMDVDCLVHLPQLSELSLRWCESLSNVDALKDLRNLKKLDLTGCKGLTNVAVLANFSFLTGLNLRVCQSLTNVDALAGLMQLTELDLSSCESLTNVDALAGMTQLTKLKLSSCKSLMNVDALAGLTQLTELDLSLCESLTNVDALAGMTQLTKLKLISCKSLTNVDALAGLTQLIELDLGFCNSLTNVDALASLTQLTELDLSACESLTNVDALAGLTKLTELDLSSCQSLTNVDALAGLTQLTELDLGSCKFLTNVDVLAGLSQLANLNLSSCEFLMNVDVLVGLTQLTKLDLSHCESLTNVDALAGLTQLIELNLSWCESLSNVNGLAGLTQLAKLDLKYCESLANVDALAGLTQLTELDLSLGKSSRFMDALANLAQQYELDLKYCESLTNVDALAGLTQLTKLDLSSRESLTSVDALAGLPRLEILDLSGCKYLPNLEPLYRCIALKELALDREDVATIILAHCAWERRDKSYWLKLLEGIEDFLKASTPMPLRQEVLAGIAKGACLLEESLCIQLLATLIEDCRQNDFNHAVLAACFVHLPSLENQSHAENILASALQDGPGCGDDAWEVRIKTIFEVLPAFPSTAKNWVLDVGRQVLEPLEGRPDRLVKVAPAVLTFFAKMELQDELDQWVERVMAIEKAPEAVDAGLSALARYRLKVGRADEALVLASKVKGTNSMNALSVEFTRHFSSHQPVLVGEHLDAISDLALKKATALDLLDTPGLCSTPNNFYALLMSLQGDRQAMEKLLETLASDCPKSKALEGLLPTHDGRGGRGIWSNVIDELVEKKILRQSKRERLLAVLAGEKQTRWKPFLRQIALHFLVSEGAIARDDLDELLGEQYPIRTNNE